MQPRDSKSDLPLRWSLTVQLINSVSHYITFMLTYEQPQIVVTFSEWANDPLWTACLCEIHYFQLHWQIWHLCQCQMWLPDFRQPWKFILSSIKGSHVRPFAASLMYLKAWFLFVSSLKTAQCITVYFKTSDRLTAIFKLTLVFRLIYHRSLFTTITIVIIKTSFIIIKKKKNPACLLGLVTVHIWTHTGAE